MKIMEKSAESVSDSPLFEKPLLVCFVCTGNTCRSPMAAAVFNDMARIPPVCSMCDLGKSLSMRRMHALSAGLYTGGEPIAENAVRALEEAGIRSLPDNEYSAHRARQLDAELLEKCDRIVGMTNEHTMLLLGRYPQYAEKLTCLPADIADPYGKDLASYQSCLAEIRKNIEEMFFSETSS